jgi:protein-disulfide isomerase
MGPRLRFVFRNFPQASVHPRASVAAQAAEAAAAQGKFWAMHDQLFEHQDELADTDLETFALRAGLEVYKFRSDLSSEQSAERVRQDYEGAIKSGVNKTPSLFINDVRYRGPMELDPLREALPDC